MSKRNKLKYFLLGLVFAFVLMTTFTSFGSGFKEMIEVTYKNIKIIVNDKQADLGKDSKGKEIEPFIYNGTTYLPVRAVSEALGEKVQWDDNTNTVYLGENDFKPEKSRKWDNTMTEFGQGESFKGTGIPHMEIEPVTPKHKEENKLLLRNIKNEWVREGKLKQFPISELIEEKFNNNKKTIVIMTSKNKDSKELMKSISNNNLFNYIEIGLRYGDGDYRQELVSNTYARINNYPIILYMNKDGYVVGVEGSNLNINDIKTKADKAYNTKVKVLNKVF